MSRDVGGSVGISIFGSILAGVYSASMGRADGAEVAVVAADGIDAALRAAERLPAEIAALVISQIDQAFDRAFVTVAFVATMILGADVLFRVRAGMLIDVS
ncbi:hypothetical protein [Bradyrhizobium oligotrophicum]|uniref:hypothetical protein n=1 Tax=Bradyrhizobium oligotrophicum TaxID=44255 RepID=UPI003EBB3C80